MTEYATLMREYGDRIAEIRRHAPPNTYLHLRQVNIGVQVEIEQPSGRRYWVHTFTTASSAYAYLQALELGWITAAVAADQAPRVAKAHSRPSATLVVRGEDGRESIWHYDPDLDAFCHRDGRTVTPCEVPYGPDAVTWELTGPGPNGACDRLAGLLDKMAQK